MKFLIRWGCNAIAIYAAVKLLPGLYFTGAWWQLCLVALRCNASSSFTAINAGISSIGAIRQKPPSAKPSRKPKRGSNSRLNYQQTKQPEWAWQRRNLYNTTRAYYAHHQS